MKKESAYRKEIVFLLEEPSAAAMLEGLLPKVIPADLFPRYITFEGKQDLERQLVKRLSGYRNPHALFVVMRDQDSQPDCKAIKRDLKKLCAKAKRTAALVRIACQELEAFYLADLAAVEQGLGLSGIASQQDKRKFRDPDKIVSPKEELKRLTKQRYQQVEGSRAIGQCLDPNNRRSRSFMHLVSGIRKLVAT